MYKFTALTALVRQIQHVFILRTEL